jgi:hypothetical protein
MSSPRWSTGMGIAVLSQKVPPQARAWLGVTSGTAKAARVIGRATSREIILSTFGNLKY